MNANAKDLIEKVRSLGGELWAEGENGLGYKLPPDAENLIPELDHMRGEVVAILKGESVYNPLLWRGPHKARKPEPWSNEDRAKLSRDKFDRLKHGQR